MVRKRGNFDTSYGPEIYRVYLYWSHFKPMAQNLDENAAMH